MNAFDCETLCEICQMTIFIRILNFNLLNKWLLNDKYRLCNYTNIKVRLYTLLVQYCSVDPDISEADRQWNVEGFSKIKYCHEKLHEHILHAVECIGNKYIEATFNSKALYFTKDNIHIWMPMPMLMPMPTPMMRFTNGCY